MNRAAQKPLYINGKFLAQRTTGVERAARGLVKALDASLEACAGDREVVLLLPSAAKPMLALRSIQQRVIGAPGRSLGWWEQLELPWGSRHGNLLCLSGSAPLLARRCIPTLYDAAIYLHPGAYSSKFIAWYRMLYWILSRRTTMMLTGSEFSAAELTDFLPHGRWRTVPLAAEHVDSVTPDTSVFSRLEIKNRGYFLAVGSLNPTKNFQNLVQAYLQGNFFPKRQLVIVGAMNEAIFREASGIQENTRGLILAGRVSDEELIALYAGAEAFVFPSIYEGFGIPPLEAMLCDCPVIASSAASIPEVCGDAAIYFSPHSVSELVHAMHQLTEDEALRAQLVSKARIRSSEFSWKRSGEVLRRCLQEANWLDC